jgi:hypothetical protein
MVIGMVWAVHAAAATKIHVIAFGKWTSATLSTVAASEGKPQALKTRPLLVDGRIKEYVIGSAHEVTDRLFVVRRAFRLNESLPEEQAPHWQWQRGGWLLVDRSTGRIAAINLPEFDTLYSSVSWYRDYAAYCGIADDGKTTYAMVAQIGRRKPVLKRSLLGIVLSEESAAEPACPTPSWQREPARVSFAPSEGPKQTFAIRGHIVDLVSDAEDEEEAAK